MRGDAKPLVKMLQGADTRFIIPVYQHNYDWRQERCERLFDDLEGIAREGHASHFFGSIVSKADMDCRVLIDGQQRMTTVFILLAALVAQLEAGNVASESPGRTADRIRCEWLIDEFDEVEKLKLKLVKDDQEAFRRVVEGDAGRLVEGSNVTENYRYLLGCVGATGLTAEELRDAVKALTVIDIRLEADDDAQLIFESLNSTGLALSEGDKIRNYILMDLPEAEQEECYTKYWNPIEANCGYDVSGFVRDWLTCATGRTPAIARVYPEFRRHAASRVAGDLLAELLRYSELYRQAEGASYPSARANAVLRRLELLDAGVTMPFLMSALASFEGGEIGEGELVEALLAVETYLFRRWVCRVPTNALNKVFETLHREAERGVADGQGYANALKHSLLRREGAGVLPRDDEFRRCFEWRDFYHIDRKRLYLYDRLENGDSVERVNVVGMLEDGTLTVEHIMPQTLSPQWRHELGEEADDEVHAAYVNTIGNLTLTGYNSQYSNNPFADKRDRENGFRDSGLRLSRAVALCDRWGIREIEERRERLWSRFLKLWPMPESTYASAEAARERHALDGGFEFTGLKVSACSLRGERAAVGTWVEAMRWLLPRVYAEDPRAFRAAVTGGRFPSRYFSTEPLGYGFEIGGGIWYNPGCSTSEKMETLRRIVDRVDTLEQGDISFEVRG